MPAVIRLKDLGSPENQLFREQLGVALSTRAVVDLPEDLRTAVTSAGV